jgi:UDP-2,3-diacylglucosamine pyrophosphatase LpxH
VAWSRAVRTLIVSDLHLGGRLQRDVLRRPAALAALLEALNGVHRLVLLGDIVELLEGRTAQALQAAEPVLRALGERLGGQREAILVPGNHDAALVRPWLHANGVPASADAEIPLDATPALARVAALLRPAQVRAHYPGVHLDERVWATHGHYLDRHLLPEAAFGIARGLLGRLPRDGATPADYEGGPSVTRVEALLTRWLPGPLARLADDVTELVRATTMPGLHRLVHHRFAPLNAALLGAQMRRAAIPALARVVHRLGVEADVVVFGHVHRRGPLADDDLARWRGPDGRLRIVNSGAWTYEPLLLHTAAPPHPYWPGGAVVLETGGEPKAVGLLDHLGGPELNPAGGGRRGPIHRRR